MNNAIEYRLIRAVEAKKVDIIIIGRPIIIIFIEYIIIKVVFIFLDCSATLLFK